MFPRLFQIGGFSMPTYGLLFSLAIIIGLWVSARNFERLGIDPRKAQNLGSLVVLSGIPGGTVDWFRFWLQDYEDPDPAKKEQYVRWRELRKLQEQNAQQPQQVNPPPGH